MPPGWLKMLIGWFNVPLHIRYPANCTTVLVFLACGRVSDDAASAVHDSIVRCEADAVCSVGSCVCGICSFRCSGAEECSLLGAETRCQSSSSIPTCGDEAAHVCVATCAGNSCGSGFDCRMGTCIPVPLAAGGARNIGGAGMAGTAGRASGQGGTWEPAGGTAGIPMQPPGSEGGHATTTGGSPSASGGGEGGDPGLSAGADTNPEEPSSSATGGAGGAGSDPNDPDNPDNIPGDPSCFPTRRHDGDVDNDNLELLRGVSSLTGQLGLYEDPADASALRCLARIEGRLQVVGETTAIPLERLRRITGEVWLRSPSLSDLRGLKNLGSVGELVIEGSALTDLSGLERLTAAERVDLVDNAQLESLSGLDGLENVSSFAISRCPLLGDLHGLGGLRVAGQLWLSECGALRNVNGVSEELRVAAVGLRDNPLLADFDALHANSRLNRLDVHENPELVSLLGASSATVLDASVTNNPRLEDLSGLGSVRYWNGLELAFLPIENLQGFTSTTDVNLASIHHNPALRSLTGLNPTRSANIIEIHDNPLLSDVTGFDPPVINDLKIERCDSLVDLVLPGSADFLNVTIQGCPNLRSIRGGTSVPWVNEMRVVDNPMLEVIAGFPATEAVTVHAWNNPKLTRITGFNNAMEAITISFRNNPLLHDLSGLSALEKVRYLEIKRNDALTTLSTFASLNQISLLEIQDNSALPTCFAEALRDRVSGLESSALSGNLASCPP